MNKLNVETLGQVFTEQNIVENMLGLIKNNGNILEPSCGDGAFLRYLDKHKTLGIEIDSSLSKISDNIKNIDFFTLPIQNKFDTIIGNPPYVRYQDILPSTKALLDMSLFDARSNLYLFFIHKCIEHLESKGELIFITPRDFLKSTSAIKLNHYIFNKGSITDIIELGDKKIFKNATPNCIIWRFEKDNFTRIANLNMNFMCFNGQLLFVKEKYDVRFNDLFFVKVGAVSGLDRVFSNETYGNMDFVCSSTAKTGKTKKMIYGIKNDYLEKHKEVLLSRKIRKFNESNYYQWGRDYYKSTQARIYVNTKTRNKKPFFLHDCNNYDGSILAIFPKFKMNKYDMIKLTNMLNDVNWNEIGFVCDGRFLFSQKSLENSILPNCFREFVKIKSNLFEIA